MFPRHLFPSPDICGSPRPACWLLLAAVLAVAQLAVGLLAPPGRSGARAYPPLVARGGLGVYPSHEGFAENGVYPATVADTAYPGVEKFGSWLGSDAGVGRLETPWFRPGRAFEVLVAGYPSKNGNSVVLELHRPGDPPEVVVRRTLDLADAHEQWVRQHVRLSAAEAAGGPGDADGRGVEARLVATDGATGGAGWLGVSAPFREGQHTLVWSLGVLGRLALATGAAVTALAGAGLVLRWWLRRRRGGERRARWTGSLAFVPLPGAAWLVGAALLVWRLAPGMDANRVAVAALAPLFLLTVAGLLQAPARALASTTEWRVLGLAGLVLALALAKATISVGPAGELYGETVSHTLEVGGRSDSRIAFHVVQLVAHGSAPFSKVGEGYFFPWSFASRGPLLGVASAPLALAAGARVPVNMPDQPWTPFDPEGFGVYRLAVMALGAAALLPFFAAAGALLGGRDARAADRRGLLAVALAALTPFVVHEVYFTWGKIPTAGCLAAAVYALTRRRYPAAGALTALGYLCHPLTLLYVPFLGVGALVRAWTPTADDAAIPADRRFPRRLRRAVLAGVGFGLPLLAALGFWQLVGRGDQGPNHGQAIFLNYVFGPSTREAFDPGVWWAHRQESFLNTLVPGWLFFVNASHPEMNQLGGGSPSVVHWFLQYWNTLPFGIGLLGLPVLGWRWWQAARARPGWFLLTAVGPFVLFAVYWGAAPTGMMREGLHPWVLALLVWATAGTARPSSRIHASGSWLLAGRSMEVLAMCWVPTLLTSPLLPRAAYVWLDATMLTMNFAALAALTVFCFRIYRGDDGADDNDRTAPHPAASASPAAATTTNAAASASTDSPRACPSGR